MAMPLQGVSNFSRALVVLAKERKILEQVREAAEQVLSALSVPEMAQFLTHPRVPVRGKREILQRVAPADAPVEFKNFLNLVIDRRRERQLPVILESVVEETLRTQGFEIVELISARPMSQSQQTALKEDLEKVWHSKVFLKYRENPNLIGGIIIRRGDQLIDGSLSGRLNSLRDVLLEKTDIAAGLI